MENVAQVGNIRIGNHTMNTIPIEFTINGRHRSLVVATHHTLLDVLRDDLGFTGSKACCLVGECGACTVVVDGRTVDSCLMLAVEADGADVVTVEGLEKLTISPDALPES